MAEAVVLVRPRLRLVLLAAASALFVAAGIGMLATGDPMGLLGVGFFGLCLFALAAMAFRPDTLRVDDEGMQLTRLGRTQPVWQWQHIGTFRVRRVGQWTSFVEFDYTGPPRSRRNGGTSRPSTRGMIPARFGPEPEALAALLQVRRDVALGQVPD